MNAEKFTQRSADAVRKAQSIAVMQSNNVIEPIHLLSGLMKQENGLIPQLLKKMNIDTDIFDGEVDKKISLLPMKTPRVVLFSLGGFTQSVLDEDVLAIDIDMMYR